MPATVDTRTPGVAQRGTRRLTEPAAVRWTLIAIALGFLALFLVLPLATVFLEAFGEGAAAYVAAVGEPDARAALLLTLTAAAIAVPANVLFGVCAGRAIAKFDFRGQEPADDVDRSPVYGLAGHCRDGVRPPVRPPGLSRTLAGGA